MKYTMRKIEKPTIKHKTIDNVKQSVTTSPYDYILEDHPAIKGKFKYVSDEELEGLEDQDSTFKHPSSLFIAVACGRIYFRTNSRAKAQDIANTIFNGKYLVKVVVKASVR